MKNIILASLLLAPVATSAAAVDDTPFYDWEDFKSASSGQQFLGILLGIDQSESDSYLHMTRKVLQFANYVHMTGGSEIRNHLLAENNATDYPQGLSTGTSIPLFLSACLASGVMPLDYRLGFGVYEDRVYEVSLGTKEGIGKVVTIDGWSENFLAQFPRVPDLSVGGVKLEFVELLREDARPPTNVFRNRRTFRRSWFRNGRAQDRRYWERRPYDARGKGVANANSVVRYVFRLPENLSASDDLVLGLRVGTLDLGNHLIFREQLPR